MKKIIISGGQGSFARELVLANRYHKIYSPNKKKMDVTNYQSLKKNINYFKPDIFIHCAAITTPMELHEKNILKSIDVNIIGTCNVVKICSNKNIKLVYISTNFVYPGKIGNYKETSQLYPINHYGWSKLGGECAVKLYENSLILRMCMTKEPYPHKGAFVDYITSFIFNDEAARITMKLLNHKGVINIGGVKQTAYKFASKSNSKIKKLKIKNFKNFNMGRDPSINITKLKKILKK